MQEADEDIQFVKEIGERVKRYRREAQLSQEELAEKAELSRNYIGNVERGEKIVSLVAMRRIVRGLGISLGEFFGGADV